MTGIVDAGNANGLTEMSHFLKKEGCMWFMVITG
jgi:hypothetical protein